MIVAFRKAKSLKIFERNLYRLWRDQIQTTQGEAESVVAR